MARVRQFEVCGGILGGVIVHALPVSGLRRTMGFEVDETGGKHTRKAICTDFGIAKLRYSNSRAAY